MSLRAKIVGIGTRVVPQPVLDWVYDHRFHPVVRRVRDVLTDSLGSGDEPVEMTRGPLTGWKLAFGDSPAIWSGIHEPAVQALVQREVGPGDVVYDIGTHIGYYALLAAKQMQGQGRVLAYEPEPANQVLLERNIEANGVAAMIELRRCALGEESGQGSMVARNHSGEAMVDTSGGDIDITTLDDEVFSAGLPQPTLVIIDTEGMESAIFRGGQRTLGEARPRIICEHHNRSDEIEAVLAPMGYRGEYVDREHTFYVA